MAQKPRGICRNCGKNRAFFDVEHKLCSECAERLKKGEIDAPTQKIPGRKPGYSSNNDQGNGNHNENSTQVTTDYECEGCGGVVYPGQRKCKHCKIFLDWRGSQLETDPEYLICPECGCFVGYADDPPAACQHCGFSG